MAGNPLTDPDWPAQVADRIVGVVGTVRDRATTPIVTIARGVVYGLLAALLGAAAAVMGLVALTRGLQALFDTFLSWDRAVYLSYLMLGGILCLAGALLMAKRYATDEP
ncbi:MAG: hypothetical protein ACK5OX_16250 [Desertimonas sp.]